MSIRICVNSAFVLTSKACNSRFRYPPYLSTTLRHQGVFHSLMSPVCLVYSLSSTSFLLYLPPSHFDTFLLISLLFCYALSLASLFSHNRRFPFKTLSTLLAIVYLLSCAAWLLTSIYLRRLSLSGQLCNVNYVCESRYYQTDSSLFP